MQESSFLAAIRADPSDRLARLAYADWLEERDDPRAELIRVEEEMRLIPVFADRFWHLKPRRNELRAASSPEWLSAMSYGTVCEPVFRHGVPDGWKERWRLIREFVERWHRIPMPDVGGRPDEIREAETRLGRTLPPSVREWVAFAHDVRQEQDYHDVLGNVYQLQDVEGCAALSLLLQSGGIYRSAVWHRDLKADDPPVSGFWRLYAPTGNEPFVPHETPIEPSLTSFALRYAMGNVKTIGGGFSTCEVRDAAILVSNLKVTYPVQAMLEDEQIFEKDNICIRFSPAARGEMPHIIVEVFNPLPPEGIPQFLWDLTRGSGSFHGMFDRASVPTRHTCI